MADPVRCLNEAGAMQFVSFLEALRTGEDLPIPVQLLTADETSFALQDSVSVEQRSFGSSFEFGRYLQQTLKALDRHTISLNESLWNWLALYYFDELCPKIDGKRNVLQPALYVIEKPFNYQRYYRHLVRTPWLVVSDHGAFAKVLLTTSRGGTRGEILEQLGASQDILGNPVIIAGAYKLYYDEASQKPKRGTSTKGGGSPRRLVAVTKQLSLTYDLQDCSAAQFLQLLPREFEKFKSKAPTETENVPAQSKGLRGFLRKFSGSKGTPPGTSAV